VLLNSIKSSFLNYIIMTLQNDLLQLLRSRTLITRALQGAGLGLLLITIFILGALAANVNAGTWMFLPMTVVTIAGAFGGVFYCVMGLLRKEGGWKKHIANVVSVLVYFIILYFSLILGLSVVGLWH
jgi:membrane associated rhomboid family serine protease